MYIENENLLNQINETKLLNDELAFWFLGQTAFAFKYKETVLYIDPMLNDLKDDNGKSLRNFPSPLNPSSVKADFVFCTHGHIDHFADPSVKNILTSNPDAKLFIPSGCNKFISDYGINKNQVISLSPEENCETTDFSIKAISAAHPQHIYDKTNPDMALGYIISFGNIRIAHLGDTYLTKELYNELSSCGKIDVIFVPVNGTDFFRAEQNLVGNLEPEEAAVLCQKLKVNLAIPTHYDMIKGNTVNPIRFASATYENGFDYNWKIMQVSERFIYKK